MILHGNVMNIFLIILEGKYGAIDTDDYSYHGYALCSYLMSSVSVPL